MAYLAQRDVTDIIGRPDNLTWIGVLGHESRSLGSLALLLEYDAQPAKAFSVLYDTKVRPIGVAQKARERNEDRLRQFGRARSFEWTGKRLSAYRGSDMRRLLSLAASESSSIVIDVTCMTGLHVIAVADWLLSYPSPRVSIAYSAPEQYLLRSTDSVGWVATIIAPARGADPSQTIRQGPLTLGRSSHGVVLAGLSSSRLEWALRQVPIDVGTMIVARSSPLDVWERFTWSDHEKLLDRTSSEISWGRVTQAKLDLEAIRLHVESICDSLPSDGRLVLFPYGPRPFTVAAYLASVGACPDRTWYCYPIPDHYQADATVGTGAVSFFDVLGERG
jgi:hypothetical protein